MRLQSRCCGQGQKLTPYYCQEGPHILNTVTQQQQQCKAFSWRLFGWFVFYLSFPQAQLQSRNMDKSLTHQAIVQLSEVTSAVTHATQMKRGNSLLSRFLLLIFLSVGSHSTETGNDSPAEETGALHGLKPCKFKLNIFALLFNIIILGCILMAFWGNKIEVFCANFDSKVISFMTHLSFFITRIHL